MHRPLILVTNDDGIDSPGLLAAAESAAKLGDVLIVAPFGQQTAMGRSYPKGHETGVTRKAELARDIDNLVGAYSIVGSPAQVVSYAVLELTEKMPDLCISGVNFGENLGATLTCSGTIGAALEADSYRIPGIAASLQVEDGDSPESVLWGIATQVCERLGRSILRGELPKEVSVLNVNIPSTASADTEWRRTVDSRQPFWVFRRPVRADQLSPARLDAQAEIVEDTLEPDSDIKALIIDRYISVTPLLNRLAYTGEWKTRIFEEIRE